MTVPGTSSGLAAARLTSNARGGALACVDVEGDIDWALERLGVRGVGVGGVKLRRVPIEDGSGGRVMDDALVGRWTAQHATVMLHGGRAVIDGFLHACRTAGITSAQAESPFDSATYVEAADAIEQRMLAALSTAKSPAAVDLLLDQPRRWRAMSAARAAELLNARAGQGERGLALRRLIDPALVVAVGPPNIGKSSLLNALAGRSVAVVADQAGTTRDHVGTLIDLAGVVVRWVDTPGLAHGNAQSSKLEAQGKEEGAENRLIQEEAQRLAREVAAQADVLVVCVDQGGAGTSIDPPATRGVVVKVGLRADLASGSATTAAVAAAVSVRKGTGLERVVEVVREAVVPRRFTEDGEPWAFW